MQLSLQLDMTLCCYLLFTQLYFSVVPQFIPLFRPLSCTSILTFQARFSFSIFIYYFFCCSLLPFSFLHAICQAYFNHLTLGHLLSILSHLLLMLLVYGIHIRSFIFLAVCIQFTMCISTLLCLVDYNCFFMCIQVGIMINLWVL